MGWWGEMEVAIFGSKLHRYLPHVYTMRGDTLLTSNRLVSRYTSDI